MPTDEERREVAARLREWVGTPRLGTYGVHRAICYAIYKDAWIGLNGNELAAAVADLIEPEPERTCRVRNLGGINDNALPLLLCSECGEVNYAQANGEPWRYCPNCGAKAVEE